MPGLKLIGDISCFPTAEGWLYRATVLDLCSKELIGYALAYARQLGRCSDHYGTPQWVGGRQCDHAHGPRWSVPWEGLPERATTLEIRQSTSRTGSCLDGAAAEPFFATIKTEIGVDSWPDRAAARRDIENWIKAYNERRMHSSLGYETPTAARMSWQQRISMAA